MSFVCDNQEVVHGLQAAAEVAQRHEGQMAALFAQVAAAQKEAAMQQEFCSGASRRAASLDVMLSNAQVRAWCRAGDSLVSL